MLLRYKDRAERLVLAKVELSKLETECEDAKRDMDTAMER